MIINKQKIKSRSTWSWLGPLVLFILALSKNKKVIVLIFVPKLTVFVRQPVKAQWKMGARAVVQIQQGIPRLQPFNPGIIACLMCFLFGCLAVCLFSCSAVWFFNCLAAWLFSGLAVWLFVCLAVWLVGCLAVWLFD